MCAFVSCSAEAMDTLYVYICVHYTYINVYFSTDTWKVARVLMSATDVQQTCNTLQRT
jgi:hypothetical protein